MSARIAVPLLLALALGCGGSKKIARTEAPASSGQDTDLGLEELRKSLESTVLENYTQLTYGNIEAFLDGVALRREVQLIGVTPKDVVVGVNPPGLKRDRRLYRHRAHEGLRILSKNLDVHLARDGSVGWVYDETSYRLAYMSREASIPIRSTAVYVRDVERWVLVAEHTSYGLPIADIIGLVARGKLVPGRSMDTSYGSSKEVSAYLVSLVGRFVNSGMSDSLIAREEESLVLLPESTQEFHGAASRLAPGLAASFGPGTTVAVRDFRVQLSGTKRVAWMVANLAVRTALNGDPMEIPLRGSFVLERNSKKEWGLVQAHISAPLLERQLSERVFGPNL